MPAEQHSIKPIVTSVLFLESFSLIERKSKIPRNSSYTLRVPVSQNEVGEFCLVKTHAFLRSWHVFFFVIETVCYKIIFCISFHQYFQNHMYGTSLLLSCVTRFILCVFPLVPFLLYCQLRRSVNVSIQYRGALWLKTAEISTHDSHSISVNPQGTFHPHILVWIVAVPAMLAPQK